jgi:N-acyl-D-aspartate/D-glutamate deacylase
MVDDAVAKGLDVTFDTVVVSWGSGSPRQLLPRWALEGTPTEIRTRLSDPDTRELIKRWVGVKASRFPQWKFAINGQWDLLVLYGSNAHPEYVGENVGEIANRRHEDPYDALLNLILAEDEHIMDIRFSGPSHDEDELRITMKHPRCMIESDGLALATDGPLAKMQNVFTYGWAARMLGKFVRDEKVLHVEDAVRKMTSLPAQRLGLRDRGLLREGMCADIVMVDWEEIHDKATVATPSQYPTGFACVLVNGEVVFDGREHTGALPGTILRA